MIMPESFGIIFDALIIILLFVTILYSIKLSRLSSMFQRIQNDKKEMENLLQQLSNIIDKANSAIQNMKEVATDNGGSLQKNIDDAKTLADELEIMLHSGNNLASRLQELADSSKTAKPDVKNDKQDETGKKKNKPEKKKKDKATEKMIINAIGGKKGGKK